MGLTPRKIDYRVICLYVDGVQVNLSSAYRLRDNSPIVFLHGFGSTKEDYLDIACQSGLEGRGFVAYDAPGCGQSSCEDMSKVSIPFLVETAKAMLQELGIQRYHLIGHSMGGLTALILAHQMPERVLSFVNIEGNVAPEDCFLSRQVLTHPSSNAQEFLDDFVHRTRQMPFYSSALYAANVRHKVHPDVVRGIFESMVQLSDHSDLMSIFLSMPFPSIFMYGEQNSSLSYLAKLRDNDVELAEIPHSGHWPMYSNPVAMWQRIQEFYLPCSQNENGV
ncbi:alpha/beta hydrolase protein [Usnea florida]